MRTAAVIQAAGKGSRFHSDQYKLLSTVNGVPMIKKTLEPVLEAGFDTIVVVVGSHCDEMTEALHDFPVRIVNNTQWEQGQSTSLAAGMMAIENLSDRVCLLLGDQPFLQTGTLRSLLCFSDLYPNEIIVPIYKGKRGNPIIVPSLFYKKLLELTCGDIGGRKLLETAGFHALDVDDPGILRDIDTVEELKNV